MSDRESPPAVLLLEDGTVFKGRSAGSRSTTTGELCFNTAMTGYQEAFTDPSYCGQILIMTNVHIGNYGVKDEESEHDSPTIKGMVCRNFHRGHSRPSADHELHDFLEKSDVPAIEGIDSRALVRHIRSKGAMNAIISSEELDTGKLMDQLKVTPSMKGLELASGVSVSQAVEMKPEEETFRKIAVMDYGIKKNILRSLLARGCELKVFPAKTPWSEVEKWKADGYFLSNGPGDPAAMEYAIAPIESMLDSGKPLFGICLGHQLLCMSQGIKTYKMHHGHRGINHPVLNKKTGKAEVTSQNHGFGVDRQMIETQSDEFDITHVNLNDNSVEGISLKKYPAFSVQYHPEAAPGPHDSAYLFDNFIELIDLQK
jgi:carbamoyl-phosphate synthase small subunit